MILLTVPIFFPMIMGLPFGLTPEHTRSGSALSP